MDKFGKKLTLKNIHINIYSNKIDVLFIFSTVKFGERMASEKGCIAMLSHFTALLTALKAGCRKRA
jgi:hypothetical protein